MKLAAPTKRTEEDQAVIDKYVRELGVKIFYDVPVVNGGGPNGPRSNSRAREVHTIPLSEKPASFWTTMHELGHIALKHEGNPLAMYFGDSELPEQEAAAWAWAVDHAGRPLDEDGKNAIGFSLASYISTNGGIKWTTIGPNLERMFAAVGTTLSTTRLKSLYPGNEKYFPLVRNTWASATEDQANAA